MERLRISTSRIRNDGKRIQELNESIPTLVRELEDSMNRLSACWEGPAWGAFQTTVAEYMELLGDIYKSTAIYAANLEKAGEDYHRAEQDVCSAIDRVIVL